MNDSMMCTGCGSEQEIVGLHSFPGFAGGSCEVWTLACGHQVLDDSDDLAAAR